MKTLRSSPTQLGSEARTLPPCAKSWEDYDKLSVLLNIACFQANNAFKKRRTEEPPMYLIDDGGYAGAEAMTVLHPPEDLEG